MTFLYKTVCQDDFVADVEEIQNTGDIAALFCPNFKNSIIQGFGIRFPQGISFFFKQLEQTKEFCSHLDIL